MSLDPCNSDRLEETLESARRGIRKLEIDAYRLRNDLTRLEVAIEDGLGIGAVEAPEDVEEVDAPPMEKQWRTHVDGVASPILSSADFVEPTAAPIAETDWRPTTLPFAEATTDSLEPDTLPDIKSANGETPTEADLASAPLLTPAVPRKYRHTTPPVLASLSLHVALLLGIVSITVATIVHEEKSFTTTYVDLGDKPTEPVPLENFDLGPIAKLDETNLQDVDADSNQVDPVVPIVDNVSPFDFQSESGEKSVGDLGAVTALKPVDSDSGTFESGNNGLGPDGASPVSGKGSPGQKRGSSPPRNAGPMGAAMFFGAKAKGNRFVFVVDNSSSMK